jgi:hypothetical protein
MPSSYSTNLKIELQATGENSGTWGTITNTNLGTALEQAIIGYGNPNYLSDANLTLTYTDTNSAQTARALVLNVTSALSLTGTRELVVPTIQKQYIVQNNTTGGQSITVKTSAGTGITVPNGRKAHLYVNGTDVIYMDDFVDINGGTIDGTTIGGSSAAAGTFTTLTASSIATFAAGSAAAPSITTTGDTNTGIFFPAADTIAFTEGGTESFRINSSGNAGLGTTTPTDTDGFGRVLDIQSTGGGQVAIRDSDDTTKFARLAFDGGTNNAAYVGAEGSGTSVLFRAGAATRATLDSSGNLGLGVTPSAWASSYNAFQFGITGRSGALFTNGVNDLWQVSNAFFNGSDFIYYANGTATAYNQANGTHNWRTAASGTAGNAFSFTQAMTLDASGNLMVNTTTPVGKFTAGGQSTAANNVITGANIVAGTVTALRERGDSAGIGGATFASQMFVGPGGGNLEIYTIPSTALVFGTAATERARLDSSGNLGLGVSPSAWASPFKNIQVGNGAGFTGRTDAMTAYMSSNYYYNNGDKYIGTGNATLYIQISGQHIFYTAPSGTAGNAISFTQAMTLDASGNLGIGTSSPATRIHAERSTDGVIGTFRGTSNAQYLVGIASGVVTHDASNGSAIHTWQTNGTERARLDSSGNLGIGTTAPVNKLSVLGKIAASDSNFTASAYIHASPDSGANRSIGQFSVSGVTNGLQVNWDHASSKMHIIINNIPTSSAGLPGGTLYSDGGTIKIA